MSFFNKIFGGGEKKEAPVAKPQPQVTDSQAGKIKIESAVHGLDVKIKGFEDNEKKFENKVNMLKAKAKEYLENGQKKEAKKYVEEATRVQKQLENYSLRRKALVDKKFQLEQAAMDKEAIEAMTEANENMKDQEKYTQKLEDLILDGQEAKMQQQEINDKLKDLVDNDEDEEDVDDMLNELMGEIKKDKQENVAKQNVQVNVPQQQKQPLKQKQERDQIEDMLNAL